jgi:hypothetical protein
VDDDTRAALEQVNARLDYIEAHIEQMSKFGAQILFAPMGRNDYPPTDPGHVPQEVIDLARSGRRKDAIVRYRALTAASPQEAAAIVDGLSAT